MDGAPTPPAPPPVRAAPAPVTASSMLAGRYTVDKVLGRGGMSTVYQAYDTRFSNRVVAIKEMVDSFATPEERAEATRDFLREADILAALRHPAIPAVFDRFSVNARHYLVMEHIEGGN
ncbi:MAG: protein kinase domain-containing protein, partial [Chloroflexota bacterium]